MKKSISEKTKSLSIAALCLTIAACAGGEVKPDDRDKTGSFDGAYKAKIATTPAQFRVQNWRITCWDMAGDMNVNVKDGTARVGWNGYTWTGHVSKNGTFKIVAPARTKASTKTSNKGSLRKEMNYVVSGNLRDNKMTGRLTHGYQEFANQGCNSKVSFDKVS